LPKTLARHVHIGDINTPIL